MTIVIITVTRIIPVVIMRKNQAHAFPYTFFPLDGSGREVPAPELRRLLGAGLLHRRCADSVGDFLAALPTGSGIQFVGNHHVQRATSNTTDVDFSPPQ